MTERKTWILGTRPRMTGGEGMRRRARPRRRSRRQECALVQLAQLDELAHVGAALDQGLERTAVLHPAGLHEHDAVAFARGRQAMMISVIWPPRVTIAWLTSRSSTLSSAEVASSSTSTSGR